MYEIESKGNVVKKVQVRKDSAQQFQGNIFNAIENASNREKEKEKEKERERQRQRQRQRDRDRDREKATRMN